MKQIFLFFSIIIILNPLIAQDFSINKNNEQNLYLANNPTTLWDYTSFKYFSSVDIIDTIYSNDTIFYIYRNDFLNISEPYDSEPIFNKYSSSILGEKCFAFQMEILI
jgi:hypothetical protein